MRWVCVMFFGVALAFVGEASAAPRIIPSLEWRCARSHEVLVGKIVYLKDARGGGKNRDLFWLLFQTKGRHVALGLRRKEVKQLERYKRKGTRLLLFYSMSIQAFGVRCPLDRKSHSVDKWITLLAPIASVSRELVAAQGRKATPKAKATARFCRGVRKRLKAHHKLTQKLSTASGSLALNSAIRRAYLPLPAGHPLAQKPRCKKGCWLLVPRGLFPKAIPNTKSG